MALLLVKWGPVILQSLPYIVRAARHLYSLWCTKRGKSQQNNAVVRAMNLLIKHENDINKLLQNPEQKRELLEGLAILINKINQSNHGEIGNNENNMMRSGLLPSCPFPSASKAHSSSSSEDCGAASADKYSIKGTRWKTCNVCLCEYDFSDRKPAILICGHTFCQACLREVFKRSQDCPTCRHLETRPLDSIPLNIGLLRILEAEEEENKGDESSFYGSGCEDIPLSFDQQIQYAIFLSEQQAESQGEEYVEARWRELECAGDEALAHALLLSEFYEDSRLCAHRHESESALNPPEKDKEVCGAVTWEEEEEASLQLAFQLQEEDIAWMQKNGNNGGNNEDGHCGNQYHSISSSSCAPVEEDKYTTQEQNDNGVREREEVKDEDEGDGAMCCSSKRDEEKCAEGNAISCSRRQEEGKKDDDKAEECQITCIEDDCEKKVCKDECLAIMKAQEDALFELAIQLSLKNSSD